MRASLVFIVAALLLSACGQPDVAGLEATEPVPTPLVGVAAPIANLLRQRPAPGESIELDAYFSGGNTGMSAPSSGPPPLPDQVACPRRENLLTDQPYQATLQVLNAMAGNAPPADAAWLLATTPEATAPGHIISPDLPYHARLRGHVGDPAFTACQHSDRIFVVEQVITVYPEQPPLSEFTLPNDYAAWPRYHDDLHGYSIPYPPDWQAQRLDDATVQLVNPQHPADNVVVRVETGPASNPATLLPSANSVGGFQQGWSFGTPLADSQQLGGREAWRSVEGGQQEISVWFGGEDTRYELSVRYGSGFSLPQPLLTIYTAIVEGFRLDQLPAHPFPTLGPEPTAALAVTEAPAPTELPRPTLTPAPPGSLPPMPFPTPSPAALPGDFMLTLEASPAHGTVPLSVTLSATLTGGPDNSYELSCSGTTWEFGDGQMINVTSSCGPWTPDAVIQRAFTTDHVYEHAGTYQARLKVGRLESNAVTVEVPGRQRCPRHIR